MKRKPIALAASVALLLVGCQAEQAVPSMSLTTTAQRFPWQSRYARGERVDTPHYQFYVTARRHELVRYMPGFMEAAHRNYLSLTGLSDRTLEKRMSIYMLGSREEWAAMTRKVTGPVLAEKYLMIEAGGYCHKGICAFWDIGLPATFSVASHEGLHQFFYHRLKHPLPMWLEEGLCSVAEGHEIHSDSVRFDPRKNAARFNNLRQAIIANHWIALSELLPMDAGDAVTRGSRRAVGYYGQLWALVLFIRSRPEYRAGLTRLLRDAEAGRLHGALQMSEAELTSLIRRRRLYNQQLSEKLFRHYICQDLAAFEREYQLFAERLVRLQ